MRLVEIVLMTLGGIWQGVRQDWNLLEIALIAAGIWAWKKKGWRPNFPSLPALKHPWMWALAIAGGVIALRLALIPLLPVPVPLVTDEFSHLLLADTLLHGRLANPTHPFWPHFESLHIIQQPHYVSNYFPGHAAVLALGRLTLGNAWAGVLAECAGFLLLLYWALRGWMPARWAVFGVLLAALRFGIASYWVNAYHGGFLPAIGGALVVGAFARIRRNAPVHQSFALGLQSFAFGVQSAGELARTTERCCNKATSAGRLGDRASPAQSLTFGLGLAILAATRPFEGFLFSLPFAAVLAWEYRRRLGTLMKIAIPVAIPVAIMLAGLGFYLSRVTGSPFVTAYSISQKTYGWPMALAWTNPPPVQHRNIEFQRYYDSEVGEHETVNGPINLIEYMTFHLQEYWRFFLGPVLTIPLIMLGRVWRRRRMLCVGALAGIAATLINGAATPHYLAPATAVLVAILVECCRYLSAMRLRILPLLPATMVLVLALRVGAANLGLPYTQELNFQTWCCRVEGNLNKARITAELGRIPGGHLVFVETKTDPANLFQWIYNEAEIDDSRIVWARDLGPERNRELAAYFAGRKIWTVNPNIEPAGLSPYGKVEPGTETPVAAARASR
jgi:hypothetical protein